MHRRPVVPLPLVVVLLVPAAFADPTTKGVPDPTCQTPAEWRVHDYVAAEETVWATDGNLEGCGGIPVVTLDGDLEFGVGGALLAVRDGAAISPGGTTLGAGARTCFGIAGHHPESGTVVADDLVPGTRVVFRVTADWSRPGLVAPGEPDCGDNRLEPCHDDPPGIDLPPAADPVEALVDEVDALVRALAGGSATCNPDDRVQTCSTRCAVNFGAGADGAYWVYVPVLSWDVDEPGSATLGHITL